jgi:hypothetical protein
MRSNRLASTMAVLLITGVGAAEATGASAATQAEDTVPPWNYSASAYFYFVPNDDNYLQPTITADHAWLHLEARYNYEDLETGSVWIGYNFSAGDSLLLEITPALGGVFGRTVGIAPGYRLSLAWRAASFYTEGEYLFDTDERTDSFFYSWSELTLSPLGGLDLGLAVQRTQVYESPREFQRGLLLGASFRRVGVTAYVFDPDETDATYVMSAQVEF